MNDTIKVDGKVYCVQCFESNFKTKEDLQGRELDRRLDPTVCSQCDKDFGHVELKMLSTFPICSECEARIKSRTFPGWVKAFLAGIVAIVVFAFCWNWKYYQAYRGILDANTAFAEQDYEGAAKNMMMASKKAPEVVDLGAVAQFFNGLNHLSKNENDEALEAFKQCKDILPEDYHVDRMLLQARIGSSFMKKDYEDFLVAAKLLLAKDTNDAVLLTGVSSAYSCIYADKGQDSAKVLALHYLDKAMQLDSANAEIKFFANRMAHRMETKVIIDEAEFKKQFPNGY